MSNLPLAHQIALQIAQQAIEVLANWVEAKLPDGCSTSLDTEAIAHAQQLLGWNSEQQPAPLRLLFDQIKLSKGQQADHYVVLRQIEDTEPNVPYPTLESPSQTQVENFKQDVKLVLEQLTGADWQALSLLLLLLEKYTACLSLGQPDVAMIDLVRSTAAIASALTSNHQLSLIAGDLSGIQNFIYTIASSGALKSLRARSFYLELVTEELVQQLLTALELPRTSIIYAGGGNLYLLAPATEKTARITEKIRHQFNQWLLQAFQGKVFLALNHLYLPAEDVANENLARHWEAAVQALAKQKACKFDRHLSDVLAIRHSYETCRVCHRDDTPALDLLNPQEADSVQACPTCRQMFQLGGELFQVQSMVRSHQSQMRGAAPVHTITFDLSDQKSEWVYYHLFAGSRPIVDEAEQVLLINNWSIADYRFQAFQGKVAPLLLGNYYQEGELGFMTAAEFADRAGEAGCIPRVGYLRMDVDRLGRIFAEGLGNKHSLPRLAGLSRQMNYFFKVYLNSLANDRQRNLDSTVKKLTNQDRKNLLFIYAGGDDLFVSGAWNEIVEFAFDVCQGFRAYTGKHPDITLSGGISLSDAKYPLYQAAKDAGYAEDHAKANGRDSLSLFDEVFKWDEWLGTAKTTVLAPDDQTYLVAEVKPHEFQSQFGVEGLFGILPFVECLDQRLNVNQSRSFVRNLLATAQVQRQMLKNIKDQQAKEVKAQPDKDLKDQQTKEVKDIRYYLHLPKIAYTLARLPKEVRDDSAFAPVRISLKSPYNAPYFRAIATWIELLNR